MELIILALVLFIVGVAGTMLYDRYKIDIDSKLKDIKDSRQAPVKVQRSFSNSNSNSNLDTLLNEVKTRQKRGQSTVKIQQGRTTQTMDVQKLIEQLEAMKKRL